MKKSIIIIVSIVMVIATTIAIGAGCSSVKEHPGKLLLSRNTATEEKEVESWIDMMHEDPEGASHTMYFVGEEEARHYFKAYSNVGFEMSWEMGVWGPYRYRIWY